MKALNSIAAIMLAVASTAAAAAPANAPPAPFGCEARTGQVCHFLIFYAAKRSRNVVLPAGMKVSIPDVRIGQDSYCVAVNRKPAHKCAHKAIRADYNS